MRRVPGFLGLLASLLWWLGSVLSSATVVAQQSDVPTPDQLDELLAPIALYPDALVAQICAASTDPQQILDADQWLQQNLTLTGQARADAAQAQGFDPAFVALVSFPQVLDSMAQNIDSYAAIGRAFSANQGTVMDSIQRLRQQAYAAGNLQTNQYQSVTVQDQGGVPAVTIAPANPEVVYVPVYNPQVVYVAPDPGAVVAASVITFGVGIALGAWILDNRHPWYWGGWGWNWGRRSVIVHNNFWVVNNRYRPPRPYYHYRPPVYGRPIHARPPNNWRDRPYYRPPPGGRPPGGPPPSGGRPPGNNRPPGDNRPPPGNNRPPPGNNRPPPGDNRPPPGNNRPPPGDNRPPPGNNRPPPGGGTPGTRPPVTRPAPAPKPPGTRPPPTGTPGGPTTRPAPGNPQVSPGTRPTRPQPQPGLTAPRPAPPAAARPAQRPPNTFAGYPSRTPTPAPVNAGARPSAFGGNHNGGGDRAAASRGRASMGASQPPQRQGGSRR